ncbi:hypothetical protein [Embleya sp. MST-111070]|uniref:hypothetical protein n=1 Tax=Embleya sp. MST-111070 TaxID=3398231 RepID=UPI003F73EA1C
MNEARNARKHPRSLDKVEQRSAAERYAAEVLRLTLEYEQESTRARGDAELLHAAQVLADARQVQPNIPRIVYQALARGRAAADVAKQLGLTESYVHRLRREHVQYAWRIDVQQDVDFVERDADVSVVRRDTAPAAFAESLITSYYEEHRDDSRTVPPNPVRVLVWRDEPDADADALYVTTHVPGDQIPDHG